MAITTKQLHANTTAKLLFTAPKDYTTVQVEPVSASNHVFLGGPGVTIQTGLLVTCPTIVDLPKQGDELWAVSTGWSHISMYASWKD